MKGHTPDEAVEQIRALGDRIRARNDGKPHSDQARFFDLDSLLSRIRSHEAAIRTFGISHVDLFGSWAHGAQTNDSDVDLIVEYEPGRKASYFHLARVKMLLEDDLAVRVDVLFELAFRSHGKTPGPTIRVF